MRVVMTVAFGERSTLKLTTNGFERLHRRTFPFIGENSGDEAAGLSDINASLAEPLKARKLKRNSLWQFCFEKKFEGRVLK